MYMFCIYTENIFRIYKAILIFEFCNNLFTETGGIKVFSPSTSYKCNEAKTQTPDKSLTTLYNFKIQHIESEGNSNITAKPLSMDQHLIWTASVNRKELNKAKPNNSPGKCPSGRLIRRSISQLSAHVYLFLFCKTIARCHLFFTTANFRHVSAIVTLCRPKSLKPPAILNAINCPWKQSKIFRIDTRHSRPTGNF